MPPAVADKTTKSARYSGCSRPGDHGRMFLCRVSLGRQLRKVLPSAGLRRVPDPFPLFPSQLSPWLFGCASKLTLPSTRSRTFNDIALVLHCFEPKRFEVKC